MMQQQQQQQQAPGVNIPFQGMQTFGFSLERATNTWAQGQLKAALIWTKCLLITSIVITSGAIIIALLIRT